MTNIANFPVALQPIIQHGYLEREFGNSMTQRLGFRAAAQRIATEEFIGARACGENETPKMKAETYEVPIEHYAATTDLNMVTSRAGIASQFLQNAAINGEQAARSLDELARSALFAPFKAGDGTIIRPNNRASAADLTETDGLTMGDLLNAVAQLRLAAAPEIDGLYNCYLDPISARQLFGDADFRQLFIGTTAANQVLRRGMVNDFLGLRFIPTNETLVEAHASGRGVVRRPIICGRGALIEASYSGMGDEDTAPKNAIVAIVEGVAMVTREPIDRLQQIIAQSWYWIGGYCAPWAMNDGKRVYQRAVMIEHFG